MECSRVMDRSSTGTKIKIAWAFTVILIFLWASPSPCATFKDSLGREVPVPAPPKRLIALAPNLTEILYALGLGDRVVGVTDHCNYPPEVSLKPKVGSYIHLNVEKIVSLSPDLVIGTVDGNERYILDLLEQAHIKVFFVNPRDVRQAIETISTVGLVCGAPERARQISGQLTQRVNRVVEVTGAKKRPLVFLQINIQPIMTVNRNTVHHDLIHLAGGENMAADEPVTYPRISLEEVLRRKPEVILVSSMEREGRFEKARQDWLQWTSIPAVQKGRVHLIDSDLIDRPSPRVVDGLEIMAKLLHPEAFK
ncbi:MAG: cobalamin-binding protein [Deltaproteobacteria bacterium]|nr:cobalamin-binding protein [Deltaproteobacteria bacterium]